MKNLKYFLLWTLIIAVHTSIYSQFPFESYYLDDNHSTLRSSSLVNFDSRNGYDFPTKGVYRALTIAVNIIYDQTPLADPAPRTTNTAWDYTSVEGININPPSYLLQLMDVNNVQPFNGCLTRLFAESSFNQLVLLSDYMVVNIKQSTITPNNSGSNFSYIQLMNSVASFINNNGGLNTLYNHNSIFDFDFCTLSSSGVEKSITPDYKIDIINFILRNTRKEFGSITQGQGYAGINVKPTTLLKINNSYYGYNIGTYQCLGNGDPTPWKKFALTHEYAHFFLGNNAFHTSGGNHVGSNETNTFIGIQYGYGLFNGGLLSCNGYERWRLGWQSNTNNMYPIASNNVNSDIIAPFEGERTFLLRDFVSYGDAIRIKLPYKDRESASNQYIWLENHQCGKNGKLDEPIYNIAGSCRNVVRAGIYTYYQIGKDILRCDNWSSVFPNNEKDNLRIISAEGNFDYNYSGMYEDCLIWSGGVGRPKFINVTSNPFLGGNNQTEIMVNDMNKSNLSLSDMKFLGSKVKSNTWYNNLPWLGDTFDPFIPTLHGTIIDISSNPSAVNTMTYYSKQYKTEYIEDYYAVEPSRNTNKIYLTGLSIRMIDEDPDNTGMKSYSVKIRWDDYDVKHNVNWTGNIVLKEQLNLLPNKIIVLQQNKTPKQLNKDIISGFFSKTTSFTCENNSIFFMNENSKVKLKEKSKLTIESGASITVLDKAIVEVESGSIFSLKSGSNLTIEGSGKVIIKSGGYLCVEQGADINLQDYNSVIALEEGAVLGADPQLFPNASCSSAVLKTGNGSIADYSQDVYIQNETISADRYIAGRNIFVGNNVTAGKPSGNVLINNGAGVIFDCREIVLDAGFECAAGASFEVKNH